VRDKTFLQTHGEKLRLKDTRWEITDQVMVVLQDCLESQKYIHTSCSHRVACASSSYDADQAVNLKVEEFSDVEVRKVPVTVEELKAEHEVSCMTVSTVRLMSGIQDLTFSFSSTSIMHTISSLMNG
jgi:hypothetical protein